jgi:hypothetical protein
MRTQHDDGVDQYMCEWISHQQLLLDMVYHRSHTLSLCAVPGFRTNITAPDLVP